MGFVRVATSSLLAAVLIAGSFATVAGAAGLRSPAQYRAKMEYVCRVNGVLKTAIEKQLSDDLAAKKDAAVMAATGRVIGLILIQDRQLETTPFPSGIRTRMKSVLLVLRIIDQRLQRTLRIAATGNATGSLAEFAASGPLSKRAARLLRAAGFRYCAAMYG